MGYPATKIRVHHMGIDCRHFALEARTRAPGERVRVLTVGRLVAKKGIEDAICAVAAIARRHRELGYQIIGDGPLRARCE